jgi:hypothetical protein
MMIPMPPIISLCKKWITMNNIVDDDKQEGICRDSVEECGAHHQEWTVE